MTEVQWQGVVEDSELAELLHETLEAVAGLAAVLETTPKKVGAKLRPAVLNLVEVVRDVIAATNDVLAFQPVQKTRPERIRDLVEPISAEVCRRLDDLAAGRQPAEGDLDSQIAQAQDFIVEQLHEPVEGNDFLGRVYGLTHIDAVTRTLPVGQQIRAAFHDRQDEFDRITALILGFATRGRPMIEQLDGALHPLSLASAGHPLVAHRAARDACDLVCEAAAEDLEAATAVILTTVAQEQAMYSTHRGIMATLRNLHSATDDDERTRAVAELYRASSEGPLRMAATELLGLLGEREVTIAGLNEIKSRLLVHRTDSPLCEVIAALIEPAWRNARAHEDLHWDPERGIAMFGRTAVDLDTVQEVVGLIISVTRGFQAGIQIGRGMVESLSDAVDRGQRDPAVISRDIQLTKVFGALGFVANGVRRDRLHVTVSADPLLSDHVIIRVGHSLIRAAEVDPTVTRWTVEVGAYAGFSVTAEAIRLSRDICDIQSNGEMSFWYPPAFAPLLADALASVFQ